MAILPTVTARDAAVKLGVSLGAAADAALGDRADPVQAALFEGHQGEVDRLLREGPAMLAAIDEVLRREYPRRRPSAETRTKGAPSRGRPSSDRGPTA